MHSQSNNSQHVHVDYNPLQGRLALISSLMFRKSRSLEDIICQYIDGFLISTISLFCRKSSNLNSTKIRGWTRVLRKGEQFLLLMWQPPLSNLIKIKCFEKTIFRPCTNIEFLQIIKTNYTQICCPFCFSLLEHVPFLPS